MVMDSVVDPFKYNQAYSALLHMEESAEILQLQRYNEQLLKITHLKGRTFQMKIDVRGFFKFYFFAQKIEIFLKIYLYIFHFFLHFLICS